ncbi:MAG: ATP-binding protein [Alphaproteobacteria bacterium]|nr:ATP-binding protein [Rhodospirillales bacterium]MCW9045432.1 ATP-binding protein [Alphaproteobacteria bacterium]
MVEKKSKTKLKKTHSDEEQYRDLVNISSDAVWELGLNGLYTYMSESIDDLLGFKPDELIGRSAFELMLPDDVEVMKTLFSESWRRREPFKNIVYRVVAKSGKNVFVEASGVPLFDSNGDLAGYRGTCQNVTKREETFEALRNAHDELKNRVERQSLDLAEEANRRRLLKQNKDNPNDSFSEILKDAQQWYWETDSNHLLIMMSGGWDEMANQGHDWFMGKRIDTVVRRWKSPQVWDEINRLMEAEKPVKGLVFNEKTSKGKECSIRFTASPKYGAKGKFIGHRGWCVDISEEMDAINQAELQRERLLSAINQMEEELLLLDADDCFVACNKSFADPLSSIKGKLKPGLPLEEILIASIKEGLVEKAIGREDEWIAERLAAHRALLPVPPIKNVEGRWFQANEYRTSDGGTLVVRRDITEARKRENALSRAKDDAELASRAKSEFLANMSHELRTPLNAIIGFSDVMVHEMFGPVNVDTYKEYHLAIRQSGHHLLELINDILDLSRIEAGVIEIEEIKVDVEDMITRCIRLFEEKAKIKGVTLISKLPTSFTHLYGDPRRLRQILINLLSNSLKFTLEGDSVSLKVFENQGQVNMVVNDTGIGIAKEDVDRVFESFTQLQGAFTKENEGTGLGLPLTRSLVELHDGTIKLTSELGKGTEVTVTFPEKRIVR